MKPITIGKLISELDYSCYKYSRDRSPDITLEQWRLVFGDKTDKLEERYQQEVKL
jgi:hypothetical protein